MFSLPPLASILKGGHKSCKLTLCVCVSQFKVILPFKEEVVLSYLQPGVEYCVTAAVLSQFGSRSLTGLPHCAFTSPAPPGMSTSHFLLTVSPSLVMFPYSCVAIFCCFF